MGRRKIELSGAKIAGKTTIDMESQFHVYKKHKSMANVRVSLSLAHATSGGQLGLVQACVLLKNLRIPL